MTTSDDQIRNTLLERHNCLSNVLDAASKVHMLLPHGVTVTAWRVEFGVAQGQLALHPGDDASRIALIVWLSRMPGWSFQQEAPAHPLIADHPYIHIAAVTEMDGVSVKIWTHIAADVVVPALESGVAA